MRYLRHHPTSDMLWRTIAPSLHHCDWLFPLLALKTSSGTGSTYTSTWGRVDSKGLYGRWRLQVSVFFWIFVSDFVWLFFRFIIWLFVWFFVLFSVWFLSHFLSDSLSVFFVFSVKRGVGTNVSEQGARFCCPCYCSVPRMSRRSESKTNITC